MFAFDLEFRVGKNEVCFIKERLMKSFNIRFGSEIALNLALHFVFLSLFHLKSKFGSVLLLSFCNSDDCITIWNMVGR